MRIRNFGLGIGATSTDSSMAERCRRKLVLPVVGALTILSMFAAPIQVRAYQTYSSSTPQLRTYVSGQGKDTNPCTATSPCQTFQAALALTLAGGEIYVLNSANYGSVTITKAVSIVSEGAVGGVLATSGTGITINAGANDVINLRGLDIDGKNSGSVGIQFNTGQSLNIQKCMVRGFTNTGINFTSSGTSNLFVSDTLVANNGSYGILISPSGSGTVNSALNHVTASQNGLASSGVGIFAYGSGSTGPLNVTIADSVAARNYYGVAAAASAVMVRNSTLSNNVTGIRADQAATVRVGQSTVTGNTTGWLSTNGGVLSSYGNNNVSGNGTDGVPTSTLALQ